MLRCVNSDAARRFALDVDQIDRRAMVLRCAVIGGVDHDRTCHNSKRDRRSRDIEHNGVGRFGDSGAAGPGDELDEVDSRG